MSISSYTPATLSLPMNVGLVPSNGSFLTEGHQAGSPLYTSTIVKSVDLVFSDNFKQFLRLDQNRPSLTKVGQLFDKLIGYFFGTSTSTARAVPPEVLPIKKRRAEWSENNRLNEYREGLYFTNWPPYTFIDRPGRSNCEFTVNYFNEKDFVLMDFRLGESCYIYQSQADCLNKYMGGYFTKHGLTYEQVFGGNTTVDASGILEYSTPSEILPLNWSFILGSYSNLSAAFTEGIQQNMSALQACEKDLYIRQTTAFAVPVGLVATAFSALCAYLTLSCYKEGSKDQTHQLESVDVDKLEPVKVKIILDEKTPLVKFSRTF